MTKHNIIKNLLFSFTYKKQLQYFFILKKGLSENKIIIQHIALSQK